MTLAKVGVDETAQLPYWPLRGQLVTHQRWIRGIYCTQVTKHASEGSPGFETQGNVTRTGVSVRGPTKRLMSSQKFLKTSFTKIQKGYFLILRKVCFEKMGFPKKYVQELLTSSWSGNYIAKDVNKYWYRLYETVTRWIPSLTGSH